MSNMARSTTRTVFASAARTATVSSSTIQVPAGIRGVRVFLDVTAISATPSVVFSIEVKDPIGGDWKTLLDSAAVTAALTTPNLYTVYPGLTETAKVDASAHIGRLFRVTATHGDADSITYSAAAEFLP